MLRFLIFFVLIVAIVKGFCPPGRTGENCDKNCNEGCHLNICDKVTGACAIGCKEGYTSPFPNMPMCEEMCSPGLYGRHCTKKCYKGCKSNMCDAKIGTCTEGCNTGFSLDADGRCIIQVDTTIRPNYSGYKKFGHLWLRIVTDRSDRKAFFPAKEDCENDGGHLVYVRDMTDLTLINNLLVRLLPSTKPDNYSLDSAVWVGAEDLLTEGRFQWLDGSPVQNNLWSSGEPNNGYYCKLSAERQGTINYKSHSNLNLNDGQDCLAVFYKYFGLDDECCTRSFPYICQHDG